MNFVATLKYICYMQIFRTFSSGVQTKHYNSTPSLSKKEKKEEKQKENSKYSTFTKTLKYMH